MVYIKGFFGGCAQIAMTCGRSGQFQLPYARNPLRRGASFGFSSRLMDRMGVPIERHERQHGTSDRVKLAASPRLINGVGCLRDDATTHTWSDIGRALIAFCGEPGASGGPGDTA